MVYGRNCNMVPVGKGCRNLSPNLQSEVVGASLDVNQI